MHFIAFSTVLFSIIAASVVTGESVSYDTLYDQPNGSLNTVACSDGPNGLTTKYGYKKFSDIPKFPFIGGARAVAGWNSPSCGSCWALTFTDGAGKKNSINILAVDYTSNGFNIGLKAMNNLTGGHGVEYGVVEVSSKPVAPSVCGL